MSIRCISAPHLIQWLLCPIGRAPRAGVKCTMSRTTRPPDARTPAVGCSDDQTSYNGLTIPNGVGPGAPGMSEAAGAEAWSYDPIGRVPADWRTTITFCLTSSVAYARLHLGVDDDQRETGRNQPPKPEWPSESTTYVFAGVSHREDPARPEATTKGRSFALDRTFGGLLDSPLEELMDSKTFKASRSRRVNDIEFRINVLSIPRTSLCQQGVPARVMARGSKCSAGLAFPALRLFEVFCLLPRSKASLLQIGPRNTRGMDQPSPSSGRSRCRKSKNHAGRQAKRGKKG